MDKSHEQAGSPSEQEDLKESPASDQSSATDQSESIENPPEETDPALELEIGDESDLQMSGLTPELLESVLDPDMSPEQKGSILSQLTYQGPLPPPQMLSGYNDIDPSFAGRIMEMAEKEQASRHRLDERIVNTERLKLFFAFLVSIGLIGGAIYVATLGKVLLAGFLGSMGILTGIIRALISALSSDDDEE